MAYWIWDSSYEIGIPVIDKQHQRLVQYINELHEAFMAKNASKVPEILAALTDYTVSHFAFEEALMEEAGYSYIGPHKKVHEAFINTVGKYVTRYKDGENIIGQLMAELQIWLTHHIKHDDRDYGSAVKKMLEEKEENKKLKAKNKKKSWFARLFG